MHTYKRGDIVTLVAWTPPRGYWIVGKAIILRRVRSMNDYYFMRPIKDGVEQHGEENYHFVELGAQRDPEAWVAAHNTEDAA